jgi:ArsR family metal-binding transcriptional regulator
MYLKKVEIETIKRCMADKSKVKMRTSLSSDISELLPYLKRIYPESIFYEKPTLELEKDGATILLEAENIILNKVNNTSQGIKLIDWLKEEINRIYENREEIEPDYTYKQKLSVPELYKNLPKTNCGKCGETTCLAFATQFVRGKYELESCDSLFTEEYQESRNKLKEYI